MWSIAIIQIILLIIQITTGEIRSIRLKKGTISEEDAEGLRRISNCCMFAIIGLMFIGLLC